MTPKPEKGEAFMKAVVKASLYALFSIGVRSQVNIDRFVIAFTENLEKNLEIVGMRPQAQEPEVSEVEPIPEATVSTGTSDPKKDDLSIIKSPLIKKALEKMGIDTMTKLITTMQQKDLTTIKGIGKKSVDEIRKAVTKWNSTQS